MKKISAILTFLPLFTFAQQSGFNISGEITGLKSNTLVALVDANNPTDTLAQTVNAEGKFSLKGSVPQPGLYNIIFAEAQKKGIIFLDNSSVSVNGDLAQVQNLKFSGSKSQDDFVDFQKTFNPLFQELSSINQQVQAAGLNDTLKSRSQVLVQRIQTEIDKFLQEKKESYVAPFLILVTAQLSDDMSVLEKRYKGLSESIRGSFYGNYLKEMLASASIGTVGTQALDFTQNDVNGKPIKFSSFKGKYVLIDFWASWCGPCRQENPNVVSNFNEFKNKNFTVLGVSLDRAKDAWVKAIKDDGLTWTHVSDLKFWNNEVAQKYKISQIPKNYLVDPQGKIVAVDLRGAALREKLKEVLK